MPGDYVHVQAQNSRKFVRYDITNTAKSAVVLLAPKTAKHTLFIQRIVLSITTHAAKQMSYIDDHGGTDTIIAEHLDVTPQAAGVPGVVVWDFGPHGIALTQGASLTLTGNASGSGMVAVTTVEGYEKLTGVLSANAAASAQ